VRGLLGAALILAVAASPAAAEPWSPDVGAAAAYAHRRAGDVSFAVRTEGRLRGLDVTRSVRAASVLKAMLLVTYLRRPEVRGGALGKREVGMLEPMVRWSDSAAATRVRDIVGNSGLRRLARRTGMRRFVPSAVWGTSSVNASDQTRFFLHLDRFVPARHRPFAMRLLGSIVRSQRWGVGRVPRPGWALYFKGGWGSGTGVVDHQVALLRRGSRRFSLAIMTTSSPSHAYAKETLRGVAARLLRGLGPDSEPR
jgi:hypothetical protein